MNKVQKTICVIIFFALMIITTVILYSIDQNNNQYILIIDNDRISLDKYVIYSKILKYNIEEEYIEKNGLSNIDNIWNGELYGVQAVEYLKEQIINTIIKYNLTNKKFNELELELSQDRISEIDNLIQMDATKKQISKIGITEKEYKEYLIEEEKYNTVYNYITENIVISDSEANKYIKNNNYGSIYIVKRIIFSTRDKTTLAEIYTDEEKKKIYEKAESVLKLLDENNNFNTLALEYSDTTSTYKPGEEYIFIEGTSENKKVEEIAKQLEIGSYSQIFESTLGYEIIKLEKIITQQDELYLSEIKQIMSETEKQETFNKEYDKWYRLSEIDKNNSVINNIKII